MAASVSAARQSHNSPWGQEGQTKRLAYDGCEVYKLFPAFVGVDAHFLPASRLSALVRSRASIARRVVKITGVVVPTECLLP